MSSEPTPGEVGRALDQFRRDVHDDFDDLRRDLRDGLASVKNRVIFRDTYAADELRRQGELQALRDGIKLARDAAAAERKAAQQWRDKRDSNRKWLIGAVLLPIGGVIVELINLIRSWH